MAFVPENHIPTFFNVDPLTYSRQIVELTAGAIAPVNVIHAGDNVRLDLEWIATGDLGFLHCLGEWPKGTEPPTHDGEPCDCDNVDVDCCCCKLYFEAEIFFDNKGTGVNPTPIVSDLLPLVAESPHTYNMEIDISAAVANRDVYQMIITLRLRNRQGTWNPWHGQDDDSALLRVVPATLPPA